MSSISARLTNQVQFAYVPHTSSSGETWTHQWYGTTTGNGAAGGTTIVDTGADAGDADDYNGRYWVEIRSGACKGQWKRIVDDNGSGTFTLENNGFTAIIASGVEYSVWLSPEPVVVVDSSSGETNMVDAVRGETADFWNGYYAVPITGTHRGKLARITDFSSGTFTLAASFGSALTAGDVVLLRRFVEIGSPAPSLTQTYVPRAGGRLNFSVGDGVAGARSGTFSFETDVLASGSLAAASSPANTSALHGLFQGCGYDATIGTSSAVSGSGSSTNSIDVTTATWESFPLGSAVQVNGEARFVNAYTDGGVGADTLGCTPNLSDSPDDTVAVNASTLYAKSTSGNVYGVCLELERDGVRTTMTGCKGNVVLSLGEAKASFSWTFNVDHWTREIEAAPYNAGSAYTTALPVLSHERLFWLDEVATNIGGAISASMNVDTMPINIQGSNGVNGRSGYQVTNLSDATMTFRQLLTASGELDAEGVWGARTAKAIHLVLGSHGNCVALRMPVAGTVEVPSPDDESGMLMTPVVMKAHDAGTYANPSGTILKVPDFSISIF